MKNSKNIISSLFPLIFYFTTISNAQDCFVSEINFEKASENILPELKDTYTISKSKINTKFSEIGCSFFKGKYIIYSSRRTGAIGADKDLVTNNPFTTLYCVNIDNLGNLSNPYFFATPLNLDGNEGGISFHPNTKTIYFTNSSKENSKNYQLYKGTFNPECRCKQVWKNEGMTNYNNNNYSIEHPTVADDGKKIYFSSNMPGGFGGYDIYSADLNQNGDLVNLQNLGEKINTIKDEKYPFITPDNKLYFSSNGLDGYGGQDIFITWIKKNSISKPFNLGKSINSSYDEIAFTISPKNWGFFSSNKEQNQNQFDIYQFSLDKIENTEITGIIFEKNSKIALPNTLVTLIDSDGNEISSQLTNENGSFNFDIIPIENYTVITKKDGYLDASTPFKSAIGSNQTNIELEQKKAEITKTNIIVENIYFDYNKTSIKKESTLALNKIYDVLLLNPEMKITINAHTDARGSEKYNLLLSEKRANSASVYLINKGISHDRVIPKGHGESQLLSNCKTNCSQADYDKDRRIEFLITK